MLFEKIIPYYEEAGMRKVVVALVLVTTMVSSLAIPLLSYAREEPGEIIAQDRISLHEIGRCSQKEVRIVQEMASRAPSSRVKPGTAWSAVDQAKRGGGWEGYSDGWGGGTCWWAEVVARAVNKSDLLTVLEWHPHSKIKGCEGLATAIWEGWVTLENGEQVWVEKHYRFRNDTGRPIVVSLDVKDGWAVATISYERKQIVPVTEKAPNEGESASQVSVTDGLITCEKTETIFQSCKAHPLGGGHPSGCWCSAQCVPEGAPADERVLVVEGSACTPCGVDDSATTTTNAEVQPQEQKVEAIEEGHPDPLSSGKSLAHTAGGVADVENPEEKLGPGEEYVKYSHYWPPFLGVNCFHSVKGEGRSKKECRSAISGCQTSYDWPGRDRICAHAVQDERLSDGQPLWTSDWEALFQEKVFACPPEWGHGSRIFLRDGSLLGICADTGDDIVYGDDGLTFIDELRREETRNFESQFIVRVEKVEKVRKQEGEEE